MREEERMTSPSQTTAGAEGSTKLVLTRSAEDLVLASYGRVCVAIWNHKPSMALFEEQRAALSACTKRYPGEAMFLCVVSDRADPPDSPVRDASAKMMRDHAKDMVGCACVIEGSGFRAAITRSVLTGMTLLARTPVPLAYFENMAGAVQWLHPKTGQPLTGLTEQLEKVRKSGAPHPSTAS